MSRSADPRHDRVSPVGALLSTLLVSLGIAYWFVPSKGELVQRLMLDQQYARYAAVLNDLGDEVKPSDLSDLNPDQISLLTTLFHLTPREQLHTIIAPKSPPEYTRHIHALMLGAIRYVDVIRPDDAWPIIEPHLRRLKGTEVRDVCKVLGTNALALSNPTLASRIWQSGCDHTGSTVDMAVDMASAYQWSARPLQGALSLKEWLKSHEQHLSKDEIFSLHQRLGRLAMEGGNPSLALDSWFAEMKLQHGDKALPQAQIERGWSLAVQCDRRYELNPWLLRYLAGMQATKLSLKDLKAAAAKAPGNLAEYRRWLMEVAQMADWNAVFDDSFDHHLRLAALGRIESLDRCLALTDFLGRSDESAELLEVIGEIKERPRLQLLLANMLASLGEDERARPLFEAWLKRHPDDRDSAYGYACLLEDLGEEDNALRAFDDLLKHHPDDVPALKKLAENYIRAGRHPEALKLYTSLAESDHDHYTLENYALLAESEEDFDQLLAAQAIIARRERTAAAYLDIATTARILKDKAGAISLIREGVQGLPESPALRLALAEIYQELEDPLSAVEVLMHPCVKAHYPGVCALLTLSEHILDKAALLAFLGPDVEGRFDLAIPARLDLAVVCHRAGELDRSERLFASVPQRLETLHMTAEARFEAGNFEEAARLMRRYLDQQRRANPDDWVFLGDIYDLLGREEDARTAYNYSLTLLTSDLPETAYREPSSDAARVPKPTASTIP